MHYKALLLLPLLGAGLAGKASACTYELKSTQVIQCRPIELLEGPTGKEAWTFVEKSGGKGILAHIACKCETELSEFSLSCEKQRTRKLTFTLPTEDILKTCSTENLCVDSCQQLINSK